MESGLIVNPPIIRSNPFSGQFQIWNSSSNLENVSNWRKSREGKFKLEKSKLGASRKEIRSGRAYGIDALLHHSPPVVTIIQIGLFFGCVTCLKLQDNSKVILTPIPKII